MLLRSIVVALVAISLTACGASSATLSSTAAVPAQPPASVPPTRVEIAQSLYDPVVAGTLPDARRALVVAGMRLAYGGVGRTEVAREMLDAPIVGAIATERGWRFVDARGAVWRAPDFLGALSREGTIETQGELRGVDAPGTIAYLRGRDLDELVMTDGVSAPRVLVDQPIASAAFLDATNGLATIESGLLLRTSDGGASWSRVPFDGIARSIQPWGDAWRVRLRETSADARRSPERRTLEVARDGSTVVRSVPRTEAPPWAGDIVSFVLAFARATPGFFTSEGSIPYAAGHFVLGSEDDVPDVILLDAEGRLADRVARGDGEGRLPLGRCRLVRWGPRVMATCDRGSDVGPGTAIFASDDGRTFRSLGEAPVPPHRIVVGADGRSFAWRVHELPGTSARPSPSGLVWIDGRETPLRESGIAVPPLAIHATRIVVATEDGIAVDDVASGARITTLTQPTGTHDPVVRFTEDGALLVCGIVLDDDESDDRLTCHRMAPDDTQLRPIVLPPNARAVSFADTSNGIAAGPTHDRIFRTRDGGSSWEPVRIGGLPPVRDDLEPDPRWQPSVACFPERCTLTGFRSIPSVRITSWGWGELRDPTQRVIASEPEQPRPVDEDEISLLSVACGPAAADAPRMREPRAAPAGATIHALAGGGSFGRVVLAGERASRTATIDWWGSDGRGAYLVSSRATELRVLRPGAAPSIGTVGSAVLTRDGALVLVCADRCDAWWARRSQPIVRLADVTSDAAERVLATTRTDGGFAWMAGEYDQRTLRSFDASAHPIDAQALDVGRLNRPLGIASAGDAAVMLHPRLGWRVLPIAQTAMPSRLGAAPNGTLPVCTTSTPAADATTAVVMTDDRIPGLAPGRTRTHVEIAPAGSCIRAIELWPNGYGEQTVSGRIVARADGMLVGWQSERGQSQALECHTVR